MENLWKKAAFKWNVVTMPHCLQRDSSSCGASICNESIAITTYIAIVTYINSIELHALCISVQLLLTYSLQNVSFKICLCLTLSAIVTSISSAMTWPLSCLMLRAGA